MGVSGLSPFRTYQDSGFLEKKQINTSLSPFSLPKKKEVSSATMGAFVGAIQQMGMMMMIVLVVHRLNMSIITITNSMNEVSPGAVLELETNPQAVKGELSQQQQEERPRLESQRQQPIPRDQNENSSSSSSFADSRNRLSDDIPPPQVTTTSLMKPVFQVLNTDNEYRSFSSPVVVDKFKLIFFDIPKNSCTAWKTLFRRMVGFNGTSAVHSRDNGLKSLSHYSLEQATDMVNAPDWTKAIFLRDPIERFLSAYLNKIANKGDLHRAACCKDHHGGNVSDGGEDDPVAACGARMRRSPEEAFPIMRKCWNKHWAPQSSRVSDKYLAKINFFGYMDRMEEDSEALLRQIGAWEEFGQSGWGPNGTDRVFKLRRREEKETEIAAAAGSKNSLTEIKTNLRMEGQVHSTYAKDQVSEYITPSLRHQLFDYYRSDYENPFFNFTKTTTDAQLQ